ncbi:hypothetical protein DSM05_02540 [Pseudomonas sp. FW305-3-2-15-E-TSA4]|nr:hypothetical protein [Pseudomonas sp. FW305-3-2-15-E-TSA4]
MASAAVAQVRDVPNAAIMEVIGDYERGMRDADAAALERAFAPRGQYVFRRRVDGTPTIGVQAFEELTSAWASEPDAAAWIEVHEISLNGPDSAFARVTLHFDGTAYRDQLNLYRLGTEWRIVAKVSEVIP